MNDENMGSTTLNNKQKMNEIIIKNKNENIGNDSNIFLEKIKNIQILIKKDSSNKKICKLIERYIYI
jgi:hypothetical protein